MAKKNLPGLPDITTVDDREAKKKQNTSRKKNLPALPKQKTWEPKREKTQTLGEKLVSVAYGKDAPLGGRVSDIVDQAARDGKLTETENRQLSRIRSSQDENTYVRTLQQLLNKAKRSGDSNASLMEDQLTTVKGMQEISRLPQEDRKLLETYVALRPQAYPRAVAKQLHDKGYSNDDIERLAEIYSRHRNEQDADQRQAEAAQDAKDNPFVSNVKALGASAVGGIAGSLNALGETAHRALVGSQYNSIDPNLPGYSGSDYASTVRGQTAQGITDKLGDGFVGRGAAAVYSGATSAADNLVRIGIGALTGGASAVTLGLAAASSFQDGVQSASRRGGNAAQALLYGTANAGLEVATEKIPLDNLFKTGTPTSWGQLFKNAGKQAGMEIVTEEANFIGGLLADAAIMAEKSEFKGTINDLIASGMTYEEARKKAYEGLWWQAYETAISSGFSGGLMSGGASALNTVINGGFADPQQTQSQPVTPEQAQSEAEPEAAESAPEAPDKAAQAVDTMFDAFGIDRETGEIVTPAQRAIQDAMSALKETGLVSNSLATRILNSPDAVAVLQEEVGMELPGTASGNRNAVKQAVFRLYEWENSQRTAEDSAAPYAESPAPPVEETVDRVETSAYNDPRAAGGALKGATTGYEQTAGREIYPGRNADGFENAAGSRRDAAAQPLSHERDSAENFRSVPEDAAAGAVITDSGEAVGAASRDYSGFEAYNDLLTDDNVQRSRANDAKHEEIPIRDGNGQRVSEFASNAMNSEVISERDVNALKGMIQEGAFGHEVQHMDDVHNAAVERIKARGDSASVHAITRDVANGKVDEHTIAEAQVLFSIYSNRKSNHAQNMASELLLDLSEMSRQAGRQLNMFKLLRRMTPQGRLTAMKTSISRMSDELNAERSARNRVTPEIPPELEAEYVNAETEVEQNAAVEKIQQAIADQVPSTLLEKWNALRYVNMLGNFKTQGRNVAGNLGMAAVTDIKNAVGAVLESLAVKAGANIERTKSAHVNKALRRKAAADFAYVEKLAMGDGKYAEWEGKGFLRGVQEKRKIFTSKNKAVDTLLKPLEAYRQATDWAMNNEYFGDTAFSRAAYAKALAGYLKANGVTADSFESADPALMERARKYAIKEAQEATFRDDNTISDWIGKLGRKKTTPKAIRILSEGVMPFRKTPANVLVRAEEYSPLGLINAAVAAVKSRNPDSGVTGEDVINSLSKSLTGTGIFLLGMGLRNMGVLSGAEDEDENQAQFDKETGYQPYSIVLPNATYTLDWLTPAALPLFMGAQLMDLVDDGGFELKDLESALLSIADPMLEMSMLQGVNDTLDNIKYSENNLGQFAINSMVSYLTQGLTNTLAGQLERSFNADRTSTYVDKDSDIPAWIQRAVGSASQKIPGWDFQQAPYIDSTGEIEKNGSWIENLFSPGYYDKRTATKNQEELQRIADATGITGILTNDTARSYTVEGETINLTAEQWAKVAEAEGKLAHSILAAAFQAEDYALLSDKERAAMVESVYKYAGEKARMDVLGDEAPGFSAAWMKGISGKEAETILARAVQDASGLPESGYAAAREMGFSMDEMKRISGAVKETLKGIEDSNDYDTYRAVLGAAGKAKAADWLRVYGMTESRVAAMQAAADAGISNTAYLNMAEAESGIDRAFSDITKAWRTGDDVDMAQLADAYKQFSKLPGSSKAYAAENAEGRVRAYLRARDAGVSDAAFASLYKTYYTLDGKESENATKWAAELDKAVAAKTITKAQRKVLWDSLGYYAQVRQNAETYHKIYNAGSSAGVSVGLAEELAAVISNGLNPESGKSTVRTIQKFEAIVDMPGLSDKQEAAILGAYMDEGQTERCDAMTARGYSVEEYVEAYRAYLDRDNKADGIYDIMDALGVSYAEAQAVYKIYYGR